MTSMRIVRVLAQNPGVRELEGTNTWIVGDAPAIILDPGPDDEGHLREVSVVAGRVGVIVLTHDHPDHAPGAEPLSRMTGAPVRAFRPHGGAERLRDHEIVTSGGAALRTIATPGHTPDHVAFFAEEEGALFTGDAVLGRGTSVIDPPEGDLLRYLRSLKRMQDLSPRIIYPGHGPVVLRAADKLAEYVAHRAMREEQVVTALKEGLSTPEEMVATIYAGYPPEVHELAVRSLLAHLLKLEAEGRAEKRVKTGVTHWSVSEPRSCARCGRLVRGRARLCGPCSLAVLQESG
jgi:glyoxylase-like metal-dependent hydrolase (beta-lactamase superfamily II)